MKKTRKPFGMTDYEWEQEETRRIRRENVQEATGCALFCAFVVVLVWLFLKVTPPQTSGEADLFRDDVAREAAR